jgi:hypothetical protein
MLNPLSSEAEAFRFLVVVTAGAVVIGVAEWIDRWMGVAAAVIVIGAIVAWLMREASHTTGEATVLTSGTSSSTHRVLLVAPCGSSGIAGRIGTSATDVLVVVPALVSTLHSLTGGVDDERADAEHTAHTLAADLSRAGLPARGVVGADDTVLAIEDALREYGADEIVLADGDAAVLAHARERFAIPISTI